MYYTSETAKIKVLKSLCSCTCWSAALLFAYAINRISHDTFQIFSYESRINPYPASIQFRATIGPPANAIQMAFRWRTDGGPFLHAYRVLSENKKIFRNAFCPARIRQGASDGPTSVSISIRFGPMLGSSWVVLLQGNGNQHL